jgi:hypothetical protein
MKSKLLAMVAFAGLLMIAVPFTASANDKATCGHEPAWGYQHPNWYKGWWQKNCSWQYGNGRGRYNQNYFGNGGGWVPYTYAQPRYYYNDHDADDGYASNHWRWHHDRDWDHDGDRDHDRGRAWRNDPREPLMHPHHHH